jgi:hypothetical protein
MRKRARRLWLGDWQRDQDLSLSQPAAADQADKVTITPEAPDDQPRPRAAGQLDYRRAIVAAVAIGIACAAAIALLRGGGDEQVTSERSQPPAQLSPFQTPQAQPQVPQGVPPQGFGGPDLTGDAAAEAARAALQKYPGSIERVTRGPGGGGYVVHVIQEDGNEVHVLVDDDFNVRGSDAGQGPRQFAPGGRSQ